MVCKADTIDVDLASAVLKEMIAMVKEEEELREKIKKMVRRSSCELFFRVMEFNGCSFSFCFALARELNIYYN